MHIFLLQVKIQSTFYKIEKHKRYFYFYFILFFFFFLFNIIIIIVIGSHSRSGWYEFKACIAINEKNIGWCSLSEGWTT